MFLAKLYQSGVLRYLSKLLILTLFLSPVLLHAQDIQQAIDGLAGQVQTQNAGSLGGFSAGKKGSGSRGKVFLGSAVGGDYQVHVLGEVGSPGTFSIGPTMRVTDVLDMAGGVKGAGSERFVRLKRFGKNQEETLDLFAYKVFGALTQNPYLQDNDVVFVPLKQRAIEVEGPVRRSGVFELKNEKTLTDVLNLAGGLTVGASHEGILRVIRYQGSETKQMIEMSMQGGDFDKFFVEDGDVIVVPHKFLTKNTFDYNLKNLPNDNIFYPGFEDRVFLIGAVKKPGPVTFNQYYNLRQYLTVAGGVTPMGKSRQIKIVKADGTVIKIKKHNDDMVINPGDTIVVPEKAVPWQYYVNLVPTLASLGFSFYAISR